MAYGESEASKQSDSGDTKPDTCETKSDICDAKSDMCDAKSDICDTKSDITDIKSEVGSSISVSSDQSSTNDQTMAEFKQFFTALMSQIMETRKETLVNARRDSLQLPLYFPDRPDSNPRAWCNIVDIILQKTPLEGEQLLCALLKSLKGSAYRWLMNTAKPNITWSEFRADFLANYGSNTDAAELYRILNSSPQPDESLTTYAFKCVRDISTVFSDMTKKDRDKMAVKFTLAHLAKFDPRVRRLTFMTEVNTRQELHKELAAFNFRRKTPGSAAKKRKLQSQPPRVKDVQCYKCKILGHYSYQCQIKKTAVTVTDSESC
ncbi:hypothetical protein M8J75_002654 [Diaphorina citri]|nr:hypothetical protein M8J75_002654 [Diaphorina citri]